MVAFIDGYRRDGNGRLRGGSSIVFLPRENRSAVQHSMSHTPSNGCRSLDILHCAIAADLQAAEFITNEVFGPTGRKGRFLRTRYRAGGFPAKHLTWPNALGSPFSVFDCSGGLEHVAQEFVDGGGAQFGGDLAQALHDGIDRFIERGGAGGDADVVGVAEPRGIEFFRTLDLQCAQAA